MSLTRRHVGQATAPTDSEGRERRGSSIWEDEADEYWKKMEPAKRCRRITNYLGALVAALLLGGGVFYARTALDSDSIAALRARFYTPLVVTPQQNFSNVEVQPLPAPVIEAAPAPVPATPSVPIQAELDQEALRGRCRVRGVQSRWHEETCRKLCVRYVVYCQMP